VFIADHKGEIQKQVTNPNSPVEDAVYFYQNSSDSKLCLKYLHNPFINPSTHSIRDELVVIIRHDLIFKLFLLLLVVNSMRKMSPIHGLDRGKIDQLCSSKINDFFKYLQYTLHFAFRLTPNNHLTNTHSLNTQFQYNY